MGFPFSMRITGLPQRSRRNRTLARAKPDSTSSSPSTVKMGTRPESSGMPLFCMGMEARSAMSMATTNSLGSSWPICRLPRHRIAAMSTRYKITVREKDKIKFLTSGVGCEKGGKFIQKPG